MDSFDVSDPRDGGPSLRQAPLAVAATFTTLVGCWLLGVSTWVLPARDAVHIGMWRGVALAELAFAGLSFVYLFAGAQSRGLVWPLRLAACVAMGAGVYVTVSALEPREHFEGYLLLIGVLLAAHGMAAFVETVLAARTAPRSPAG